MGFLLFTIPFSPIEAKTVKIKVPTERIKDLSAQMERTEITTISVDSISSVKESVEIEDVQESFFPEKSLNLSFTHFTWGAEAGSSLDLTSHNLSTFDADVLLGYKNSIFNIVGIGAGIHRSIHTGNNFIPVYAVLRTDFRRKPSPFFLNLQAGYSFNTVGDRSSVGDFYGAAGLGINLQQGRVANTYVILSLAYQYFSKENMTKIDFDTHYIFFAKLMIGVNF